jgi:hypothetical protein
MGHAEWPKKGFDVSASWNLGDEFEIAGFDACKVDNGRFRVVTVIPQPDGSAAVLYKRLSAKGEILASDSTRNLRSRRSTALDRLIAAGVLVRSAEAAPEAAPVVPDVAPDVAPVVAPPAATMLLGALVTCPHRTGGPSGTRLGMVLAENDPRAWVGTAAFGPGTSTQAEVDKHVAWCRKVERTRASAPNGYVRPNTTAVLWSYGEVHRERTETLVAFDTSTLTSDQRRIITVMREGLRQGMDASAFGEHEATVARQLAKIGVTEIVRTDKVFVYATLTPPMRAFYEQVEIVQPKDDPIAWADSIEEITRELVDELIAEGWAEAADVVEAADASAVADDAVTAVTTSGHCYQTWTCRACDPCSCRCAGCAAEPMDRASEERKAGVAAAPSYTYAMRNRPPGYAHCPPGWRDPQPYLGFAHGTVTYDRVLSDDECYKWDMLKIATPAEIAALVDRLVTMAREAGYDPDDNEPRELEATVGAVADKSCPYLHIDRAAIAVRVFERLRAPAAEPAPMTEERAEEILVERGAVHGRYIDSDGDRTGWWQDGVFLSATAKEALRNLLGAG